MWDHLTTILRKAVNIQSGTDIKGTIDSIRKGIDIKGYNIWILACGAILASIGLDTNSPAVIIGAMLISPLMSPILGIGLSLGINDRDSLIKSIENYSIAVAASLLMSTLYFLITPLGEFTAEMDARTHPTILDVGVAFFGGVAGIVAISRKEKTNAIPGVAIATALMPPLCTAGYGLARMRWEIFGGAFYLFFINSLFIAFSTYLIVRLLKFPYIDFVDDSSRRRVSRWMTTFVLITALPSIYFMAEIINKVRIERNINRFISEYVNSDMHNALNHEFIRGDSICTLKLYMTGMYIDDTELEILNERLKEFNIPESNIKLTQNMPPLEEDAVRDRVKLEVLEALEFQEESIDKQQQMIDSLNATITVYQSDTIPFSSMTRELRILYPDIDRLAMARAIETDFSSRQDTLPMLLVRWKPSTGSRTMRAHEQKINQFICERFKMDTLKIIRF